MIKLKKCKFILSIALLFIILSLKSNTIFAKDNLNKYTITAAFNESDKTLTATEIVDFTNTYNTNLNILVFHLYADSYGSLNTLDEGLKNYIYLKENKDYLDEEFRGDITVKTILINNNKLSYNQDKQVLKIKLKNNIKPNEKIKIQITFQLKLPKGTGRMGYFNSVYSFTNWYPILSIYNVKAKTWDETPFHPIGESNYSDISNYKLSITIPKNMVLASTGSEISNNINKDKNSKTIITEAYNVRDFVFIMSEYFKTCSKNINGIKVTNYYIDYDAFNQPNDQTDYYTAIDAANKILNIASDALDFFSKTFGKYPYEKLDIVETYFTDMAMEYPKLIQMPKYYDDSFKMEFLIPTTVHEVAHQWWYGIVGNNEFKEPFLDEALTEFSTCYFFDKTYGKYSSYGTLLTIRNNVKENDNDYPSINSSVDKFKNSSEYSKIIYSYGSRILEILKQQNGEVNFEKFLKAYYETYKYKNASLGDFLSIVNKVLGRTSEKLVYSALLSSNYCPKELALTPTEIAQLDRENFKKQLLTMPLKDELSTVKFLLNILTDSKVTLVIPTNKNNLTTEKNNTLESCISNLKTLYELNYDLKVSLLEDINLTDEYIKNNNLIIMGSENINKATKTFENMSPIKLSNNELRINDIIITNSKLFGTYVCKNPFNDDKVVIQIIGPEISSDLVLNPLENFNSQFTIYVGDQVISGKY